ncbi:MAG TPA: ABC transporter permease [Chloroflexota bacterium]|jgi:peptide/nickel transport system permease protein|nr:ABC transporter permease [Chloroflexota bacterium]
MASTALTQPAPAPVFYDEDAVAYVATNNWALVWRRFRRHRVGLIGLAVLLLIVAACVLAPWIAPFPFDKQDPLLINKFPGPSARHWLGTDELGRDVLSRLLYAGRVSLLVSLLATAISILIGVTIGALAAYFGGWSDTILMRFTDIILALPTLPLLLIFSKALRDFGPLKSSLGGSASVAIIIFVLAAFGWTGIARLVYGSVLALKAREFTEASRALGASGMRIIFTHLIPNSAAPIIVSATLGIGGRIIAEASLSFLGFGIVPPAPSWGNMLSGVQAYMWRNPWLAFYPGFTILIVVLAINFVGDALRDALDPRLKT